MLPAEEDFLRRVKALCEERGILLILDEIQCGMGRTGYIRQGSHGPAVEGMVHGDNFMVVSAVFQVRIFPGRLYLYDVEGKKYLDFAAGIAVFALGYNNRDYNDALKAQIDKLIHTSNCGEVKIFFSLHIVEVHPVPPVQHNLKTVVGVKQHPLRLLT